MTRTSKRLTARTTARQRQAKANKDQRQREHTELDHATEFEVARMRRDDAAATVVRYETEMARQIDTLLGLGNAIGRVAELTGETEAEIKRLRKAAADDIDRSAEAAASTTARSARRRRPPEHSSSANATAKSHSDGAWIASISTEDSSISSSDIGGRERDG
ncbi:MAG TPA: hypothetical protein VFW65_21820 [Pseudonocardiaceae bacterium]|nr:hypothetical protein [Pseudonocardiaceae bacterium]